MNLRRPLAALLLLASALAASPAAAQISDADKATARELTVQGFDALTNKDWATAADRFTRADSLYHAPTISVGLARAKIGLGKLVAAHELYSRVTHETVPPNASPAFLKAIEDAQREMAELTPRIPGVVINIKGAPTAKVTLDDTEVPAAALGVRRPADPGQHVIRALAEGFSPGEVKVTLTEGRTETVTIELKPGPGGPPPPDAPPVVGPGPASPGVLPPPAQEAADGSGALRKKIGFAAVGVGGASLLVGAITGGLAARKHGSIASQCPGGHCSPGSMSTLQPEIDTYNTLGNTSTATLVIGGALAATGVILIVTAPKAPQKASLTPLIGAGYGGLLGRF
jgi:hypothetical protein